MNSTEAKFRAGDEVTLLGVKGTIAQVSTGSETEYTIYTPLADLKVDERELIRHTSVG